MGADAGQLDDPEYIYILPLYCGVKEVGNNHLSPPTTNGVKGQW